MAGLKSLASSFRERFKVPRSRNIKHSFFRDAKVVSVSFEARLLFLGLWGLADYKGRLVYIPIELKMEIFPADNVDIEKSMEELRASKLIDIYHDHSGSAIVQVVNFEGIDAIIQQIIPLSGATNT